jgi:predicted nuclease of predicted toxin-antitoxin system
VKLLLDEMWPADLAVQLRRRGHDVVAVAERSDLRTMTDEVVFAVAQAESRVLVTENVGDFRSIGTLALAQGRRHCGLIFTTDRRFPRRRRGTIGHVLTALDTLLRTNPNLTNSEYWLS